MPEMKPVTSSNIAAIGYDDERSAIRVTFKSGATYDYAGADRALFEEALKAESVGKFVSTAIVGRLKAEKVAVQTPST